MQLFVLSSIFMQNFSTYLALPQTTHILENQFGGRWLASQVVRLCQSRISSNLWGGPSSCTWVSSKKSQTSLRWFWQGWCLLRPTSSGNYWDLLCRKKQDLVRVFPGPRGFGEHFLAKVLYKFETDREGELSLEEGETIRLAPKHLQPRWVIGVLMSI